MVIKIIDHIGIMTNDLQKSLKFYGILGFSISTKIEMMDTGLSAVFIEKDGSKIELMKYEGKNVPKRSKGDELKIGGVSILIGDHISFSVDDIESTVAEFKEKGIIFELEPMQLEGGMKLASFKDPNGLLIELIEIPH